MTTPLQLQEWVDNLALRYQIYEKWRGIARNLPMGLERTQLANDIKTYIEPDKMADEIARLWTAMENKDKQKYGQQDIKELLLKHKTEKGLGVGFWAIAGAIIIAGVAFILAGNAPAIIYSFRAPADADGALAKKYGHLLTGGMGFEIPWYVWLIGGGIAAYKLNLFGKKKKE